MFLYSLALRDILIVSRNTKTSRLKTARHHRTGDSIYMIITSWLATITSLFFCFQCCLSNRYLFNFFYLNFYLQCHDHSPTNSDSVILAQAYFNSSLNLSNWGLRLEIWQKRSSNFYTLSKGLLTRRRCTVPYTHI